MDTCICVAESLPCSPETVTTLLTGCTPIYSKKFKIKKTSEGEKMEYHPSLLFETFSGHTSQRASPGPLLHVELGFFSLSSFLAPDPQNSSSCLKCF